MCENALAEALTIRCDDYASIAANSGWTPMMFMMRVRLVEPFCWDLDDVSRQWSKRFFAKFGKMPNFVQAISGTVTEAGLV